MIELRQNLPVSGGITMIVIRNVLAVLLAENLEAAGTECHLLIGMRMNHCYPICPIPEAGHAREVIRPAAARPAA